MEQTPSVQSFLVVVSDPATLIANEKVVVIVSSPLRLKYVSKAPHYLKSSIRNLILPSTGTTSRFTSFIVWITDANIAVTVKLTRVITDEFE